jgi:large repetitive protein
MKRIFYFVHLLVFVCIFNFASAQQNVLDPNDPDVIFTAANPPATPTYNAISKWGHTERLGWNPFSYGYKCYYFKGMAFRIKFPKTYVHNVADGKKFPLLIFLHGLGEFSPVYDNELQLLHGGKTQAEFVDNGGYDGFLVYPQSNSGYLQAYAGNFRDLVDSLVKYVKVDVDRVNLAGLSSGGQATWDIVGGDITNSKVYAAAMPICAAREEYISSFSNHITVPMWVANGGLDNNPTPGTTTYVIDTFRNKGGKMLQSFYPEQGHSVWNSFWQEPGYLPFLNGSHKANPLVYFQRTAFCSYETLNVKLALQSGFFAYEWQKDNATISGATGNEYFATAYGQYRARFKRTASSNWSDWSPTPVVISLKAPTVTPPIQVFGGKSYVLPATDGSTTTPIFVPNTYTSYEWRRVSDDAIVANTNVYNAPIGQYKVKVTEPFGCSSAFSAAFSVIASNGTNLPEKATNLTALPLSNTSIQLDWNDNPSPAFNETGFEIYRSTSPSGDYQFVKLTTANATTFTDVLLTPNTKYYYIIRAINNNGAAPLSNQVITSTKTDNVAPTAPSNLKVTYTTSSSVSLAWGASTDDVGVDKYDVFVNGVKSFTVSSANTSFVVNGLTDLQSYSFVVKAKDAAGNQSPASNQVSGIARLSGFNYKYYHGSWSQLPDFNTLTPVATGTVPNISTAPRLQDDNYAFLWQGVINIPVTGNYTFELVSDEGSKLFIDAPYSSTATPTVNNDGLHNTTYVSNTIYLTAGAHTFNASYFQVFNYSLMLVRWKCTEAGIFSLTTIPDNAFVNFTNTNTPPLTPSNITVDAVSNKRINLTWKDNSNNETGFEIIRSTTQNGTYTSIGSVASNVIAFVDTVGLSPNTKYWYKIRAIGQNIESAYVSTQEAAYAFDGTVNDGSGNVRNWTGVNNPTFSITDKKEGTSALLLSGNQYLDMIGGAAGSFPSNGYNTRSVSLWVKASAATVAASNKIIFDFGGADNGLALRFNANALQAAIASNNVRTTISFTGINNNAGWVANGWNHIAVVYDINNIKLYVNGQQRGNANLAFSNIGSSTSNSVIGTSSSANAFNTSSNGNTLTASIDELLILKEAVSKVGATGLMMQSYNADTTFALANAPTAPSNLIVTNVSASAVNLKWNDNSNNETSFDIYRSLVDANSFKLLTSTSAGQGTTFSYADTGLYANTNYYYKVRATSASGSSAFTANVFVKTANNRPKIAAIGNFSMRYATVNNLAITATDADAETLTFSAINLPSFAVLTNTANGQANIQFSPAIANQGVFNISVIVADANNGKDTATFTLTVNSNNPPTISPIVNTAVAEGGSAVLNLTANDLDGTSGLQWSLTNAPDFIVLEPQSVTNANLTINPGYADAGVYQISISVTDVNGGVVTKVVTITVVDTAPTSEKIFVNIKHNGSPASSPWNNVTGVNTSGLINNLGENTGVGLQFLTTYWNTYNEGATTGNNTGVYPDNVIRDYYYFGIFGAPNTIDFKVTALDPAIKYNITLFASSRWSGSSNNGTTNYTLNSVTKSINVQNNQTNTVTFSNISPDASGEVLISMSKAAGTPVGYLNALVIEKPFDDGTPPVLAENLTAQLLSSGAVQLNWSDVAYNEIAYSVYRSTNINGPFTLLNPNASNANTTSYVDNSGASNTKYYYAIEATNTYGTSGKTGLVNITTGNKAPVLSALNNLYVKATTTAAVNIAATDDAGDVLKVTISNLPSFGTYVSIGNGTGTINFAPSASDAGVYKNVTVKVEDNFGGMVTRIFDVYVADDITRNVFVNFGLNGGSAVTAPWNNFLSYPFTNSTLNSLVDESNVNTNFGLKLTGTWNGNFDFGMITGTNSGIFPDSVVSTSIYSSSASPFGVQLSNLNPAKKYNVVVFSSHNAGVDASATLTSGSQTVSLSGKYNSNKSEQLNGLTPSASGTIDLVITKPSTTNYFNLNALVIQEYTGAPIVRPTDLFAEPDQATDRVKLTWSDRSNIETGYEIYAATASNGSYSLVTTTGANVTTFTQSGVPSNVRYYYKIRAIAAGGASSYSNTASLILSPAIVKINFNINFNEPSLSWNNTSSPPFQGAAFGDLKNSSLINTGFRMEFVKGFNTDYNNGLTGSGIFPDNVTKTGYLGFIGQTNQVRFGNLDLRKKYRIGFFGSSTTSNYWIGAYTINGKTVKLNSINNTSKVVYLDNITPNASGEIDVFMTATDGSQYCVTSAITIEYFDDNTNGGNGGPMMNLKSNDPIITKESGSVITSTTPTVQQSAAAVVANVAINNSLANNYQVKSFPNPFVENITVELVGKVPASVLTLQLFDANSNLVYTKSISAQQVALTSRLINLSLPKSLPAGSYSLQVLSDGKLDKTILIIKAK